MKPSYVLLFLLAISSCKKSEKQLVTITAKNIAIDNTIKASEEIVRVIYPYKRKLTSEMQEALCYSPKEIVKNDGNMQSSLGNLMADLCFEMAHPIFKEKTNQSIDFALFNQGGMRAIVAAGSVTKADAFKLMPFDNELVVVTLSGEKVLELVAYFIKSKKAHPVSKSIQLTIGKNYNTVKIRGKVFDKNKTYHVLTTDYLQGGGDKMNFFKKPKQQIRLNYKMRDAIIDYFRKKDTLYTATDNRLIIK
jgi:2',3'-cyclic-nucleotide 2'-phosphodiesterase (5'-nucleotidase family)